MRDTILYMRGRFPFAERGVSAELVRDSKLILELDVDQLKAIASELESFPGFLDRDALKWVIGHYVPNEDQCKRLTRLVLGVDERLRTTSQTVNDLLSSIRDWQQ